MGDNPEALSQEKHHLGIPVVRRERPTVVKKQGLAPTPVLIENFNPVLGGNEGHCRVSFAVLELIAIGQTFHSIVLAKNPKMRKSPLP
jgi:hypothetical protein